MGLKLLSSAMLLYSMNIGILITIIPLFSQELGADNMTIGFIASTYAVAYILGALFWGRGSDILGRKLALGLGMLGYSVTIFLFTFVTDPSQIFAVRFLGGLADVSFWTVPTALIADMYAPEEMGAALGKIGTATAIGFIIGSVLVDILVEMIKVVDYHGLFNICSVFIFLIALLTLFGIQEKPRSRASSRKTDSSSKVWYKYRKLMKKSFVVMYVNIALFSMFFGVIISQFIIYAKDILGPGEAFIGLLIGSYYASEAIIQVPAGKLSDVFGRYRITVLGFILCAFGFFALTFATSLVFLLIPILIIGGGIGTLYVAVPAAIMDVAPTSQRGLISGFQNIAWGIGYFVGPALGGIVVSYNVGAPYLLCMGISMFGGALTLYGSKIRNSTSK
jgi:DHA1 family multidrug resistance protein-like MFS transporter